MKQKQYISALREDLILAILFLFLPVLIFAQEKSSDNTLDEPNDNFEMIVNGDFESGYFGFYTDYYHSPLNLKPEHTFAIVTNPNDVYESWDACGDHTSGDGYMMVVNGSTYKNQTVWHQIVTNITPQRNYKFSFWYNTICPTNPAMLRVLINDNIIADSIALETRTCNWKRFEYEWKSLNNSMISIKIVDLNREVSGNDFALDDISIKPCCSIICDAGNDIEICEGETVQLQAEAYKGFSYYDYEWYPTRGLNNPYVPNPMAEPNETTTYYLTVSDSLGCTAIDSVTISVIPNPAQKIKTNKATTICPCEEILLWVDETGQCSYEWSTGEKTPSIVVSETGNYSVTITNWLGCSTSDEIHIEKLEAFGDIAIDYFEAKPGEMIEIPIVISTRNMIECGITKYRSRLRYNKSLLLPVGDTPFGYVEGNEQIIDLSGELENDTLKKMTFLATLGDSECTDITFDYFEWECDEIGSSTVQEPGQFCLKDICITPTPRLYRDTKTVYMSIVSSNPASDRAEIEYNTIEPGFHEIFITNSLGERVATLISGSLEPGPGLISKDLMNFSTGAYFLTMRTPSLAFTKRLNIIK